MIPHFDIDISIADLYPHFVRKLEMDEFRQGTVLCLMFMIRTKSPINHSDFNFNISKPYLIVKNNLT